MTLGTYTALFSKKNTLYRSYPKATLESTKHKFIVVVERIRAIYKKGENLYSTS